MRRNQKFLIVVLTIVTVILGACGNSTAESNTDNQQSNSSSDQDVNVESSNKDATNEEKNTIRNASISTDNNRTDDQEDTINIAKSSNDGSSKANTRKGEMTESKKDQFLQKLNDTKKVTEELKASDSSTYALKKVENDRWVIWDELLNGIYGVLKAQLQPVEMDVLREEQRKWMKYRDESALEASLKFKGGTQEHLEYVTVLANLTEERCFELVGDYMK